MTNTVCIDEKYSTTRLLTKEKPILVNSSEGKFETILFLPEGENRTSEGGLRTKGYFKKSYEDKPLVSIITVVYNGEKYLEQTIQSVINQTYDNVEYIIIDGGSTDGTVDIIKKYEEQIDYWVSEKDAGIYDAMNKGISLCLGELVGLINADDYYELYTVENVGEVYISKKPNMIYGDMGILNEKQKEIIRAHSLGIKYGIFSYNCKWIWIKMLFGHPTSFVSRETYKRWGLYDTNFKIAADYEFFLRIFTKNIKAIYVHQLFAWFRLEGISSTNKVLVQKENFMARKKHSRIIAFVIEVLLYKRLFWRAK